MSIATVSVLRRILDDVRQRDGRVTPPVVARIDADDLAAGERLWVFESAATGRAPFASALHFWAHGLASFLEADGKADLFDAVAGGGLCDAGRDAAAGAALQRLAGDRLRWGGPYYETYCMVDQPVFQSYVGESQTCYRAFFWQAPGWTASTFRYELEPEPEDAG